MLASSATDLRGKCDGIRVEREADGYRLEVARPGAYQLRTAGGRQMRVDIPGVPEPIEDRRPLATRVSQRLGRARARGARTA